MQLIDYKVELLRVRLRVKSLIIQPASSGGFKVEVQVSNFPSLFVIIVKLSNNNNKVRFRTFNFYGFIWLDGGESRKEEESIFLCWLRIFHESHQFFTFCSLRFGRKCLTSPINYSYTLGTF